MPHLQPRCNSATQEDIVLQVGNFKRTFSSEGHGEQPPSPSTKAMGAAAGANPCWLETPGLRLFVNK